MDSSTTQVQAFQNVAQQICDEILQGYNGTIFVYGQSGSGKTHTMYGPDEGKVFNLSEMGVIPQSCGYIFEILKEPNHRLLKGMESSVVQCEFIEIYNNQIKDLLNPQNKPQIRERKVPKTRDEWKVVVEGLETRQVFNLEGLLKAIRDASKHRTVAKTKLNPVSSRSHMIMRLIVKITTKDGGERTGVGNFADLAGSEKVKKTGAQGQQLKEAQGILSSLSTLSAVINALTEGRNPPFKESKLTFALKDSLGGNSKTALLIACSPHVFNRTETINSLFFGRRCRMIQNKAKVNVKMTRSQLEAENEKLQEEIRRLRSGGYNKPSKPAANVSVPEVDPSVLAKLEEEKKQMVDEMERLKTENDKLSDDLKERDRMKVDFEQKQQKYDEMVQTLSSKEEEFESVKQRILEMERDGERVTKQRDDLQLVHQQLSQSQQQLMVEKTRLLESNQKVMEEVNRWKQEVDRMKESESALQAKWTAEMDSKKSQFSKQELELSQQIESMQATIHQQKQNRISTERELKLNQETMSKRQERIHHLEDELRALRQQLEDEKVQHSETRSENEMLKSKIEGFESKLRILKLANLKEENQHNAIVDELRFKMNGMENQMETKDSKLMELENRMAAMERAHTAEMDNMRRQMQSLRDVNAQLNDENQMAVDVMDSHKARAQKQQESLTLAQEEKDMIARQLQQLQSHYRNVVRQQIQQQIEDDAKLARELEQREREHLRQRQRKNRKQRDDSKSDDEEDLLLINGHSTPMGPADDDVHDDIDGITPGGPSGHSHVASLSIVSMSSTHVVEDDGGDAVGYRESADSENDFNDDNDDDDEDDDDESAGNDFFTHASQVYQHKRTQSKLSSMHLQAKSDDDDRKQQMKAFTEQHENGHLELNENSDGEEDTHSVKQLKEELNQDQESWDEHGSYMDEEKRRRERLQRMRNSVSVADLDNNDYLTPKGNEVKRRFKTVKRMRDRIGNKLDAVQQDEEDKQHQHQMQIVE